MNGTLAIPDGGRHLTCCCYEHWRGRCLPRHPACCGECPEAFVPGQRFPTPWALAQVAESARWWHEGWGTRAALVEIGQALEWFDRDGRDEVGVFRRFVVFPQVGQVVRMTRRVREALWSEVPF